MTYHRIFNQSNTTGDTSGARTANLFGAPEFTPGFWQGTCYSIFSFMCNVLQIVLLYFFFWALHCLSFDLRLLINPLISSISTLLHLNLQMTDSKTSNYLYSCTRKIIMHDIQRPLSVNVVRKHMTNSIVCMEWCLVGSKLPIWVSFLDCLHAILYDS